MANATFSCFGRSKTKRSIDILRQPTFGFLDLPTEIRNLLYSFFIPDRIFVGSAQGHKERTLLHTSRKLRKKCTAILVGTCTFYMSLTGAGEHIKFLGTMHNFHGECISRINTMIFQLTLSPTLSGLHL